jgi:hypothetical protein
LPRRSIVIPVLGRTNLIDWSIKGVRS